MAEKDGPMRVLAIGAHPDDLEVLVGGTLAKYAQRGDEVIMAVVTDGAAGHTEIPPDELRDIRHEEAANAAKVIGAEFFWLGFPDELLFEDIATRLKITDMIRAARPDFILTHDPDDYHPDHRAVSRLVFDASFLSQLPNIETAHPYHPQVQPLYYFDTVAGIGFIPTEYVDISETFHVKQAMYRCHTSQIAWIEDYGGTDSLDLMDALGRARGFQAKARYAEGFRPERARWRQRAYRLLP